MKVWWGVGAGGEGEHTNKKMIGDDRPMIREKKHRQPPEHMRPIGSNGGWGWTVVHSHSAVEQSLVCLWLFAHSVLITSSVAPPTSSHPFAPFLERTDSDWSLPRCLSVSV